MNHKELRSAITKGLGVPTPEQLVVINSFALKAQAEGDVYVRTFLLAHNAIDRDGECFADPLLDDFARTLPGKGFFVKHPNGRDGDSGPGAGRMFEAHVETVTFDEARKRLGDASLKWAPDCTMAKLLYSSAYIAIGTDNEKLRRDIDAGVATWVSIGFSAASRVSITDAQGKTIVNRWLGPGEGNEGSMVWLGAQPGARTVKNANQNPTPNTGKTAMELKLLILAALGLAAATTDDECVAAVKALKNGAAAPDPKLGKFDAVGKALGAQAALLDTPDDLARFVAAGKAYRATLVDSIVTAERHAGTVGDDEPALKAAREMYDALPTEKLEAFAKRYGDQAPAGARMNGGDPNPGHGNKSATMPADSPFANPLI